MMRLKSILVEFRGTKGYLIIGISLVLILLPILFMTLDLPFPANVLFLCLLYSIMAMAWNLLFGYCGQFSLGHSIFFGLGAYTTMIGMLYYNLTPWIGIFVGGFIAALSGLGLGVILFRLRSHWFALASMAIQEMFLLLFIPWTWVGGSAGLQAPIVSPDKALYFAQYAGPYLYIYIALGILAIELIIFYIIVNSKWGYYFQAIREDEDAAKSLGINPFKYKMVAMFFSALFTGIAGGIYVIRFRFIDPFVAFNLITIAVYILVAAIIGGVYSFIGPIVGSFIFMPITEYVRVYIVSRFPRYYGLQVFSIGLVVLIISLIAPEGVMGLLEKRGIVRRRLAIPITLSNKEVVEGG